MDKQYALPVAIVIAAILIAGAIYYRPPVINQPGPAAVAKFKFEDIPKLAEQSGVNRAKFEQCWQSGLPAQAGKYTAKVAGQAAEAVALGGGGTPFPIIVTREGKTVVIPGAVPIESLRPVIDSLLNNTASTSVFTTLPQPLPPITAEDHTSGALGAPLTLIEYSDLDCPYCKRFHETMKEVKKEYGDKVLWVYRHWPIVGLHPNAAKEAEATECITELGGQDAFWRFLDLSFAAH
ncbi:MAG: thioredoxin domain-containing protein [Candidatus Vogelbacteria bacterium]|nr:thioredoxin domain-containing protein [Candidatus Vogelbacteria bacterium]